MSSQPQATPPMHTSSAKEPHSSDSILKEYGKGVAEESGKQTVEFLAKDPDVQQQLNNTEDEAKGLWNKYCGCFGSA